MDTIIGMQPSYIRPIFTGLLSECTDVWDQLNLPHVPALNTPTAFFNPSNSDMVTVRKAGKKLNENETLEQWKPIPSITSIHGEPQLYISYNIQNYCENTNADHTVWFTPLAYAANIQLMKRTYEYYFGIPLNFETESANYNLPISTYIRAGVQFQFTIQNTSDAIITSSFNPHLVVGAPGTMRISQFIIDDALIYRLIPRNLEAIASGVSALDEVEKK
jgi:hypothetical protein